MQVEEPKEVVAQDLRQANASQGKSGTVVCIIGMHRSGTSVLAGSLQKAGLFLGAHFVRNRHNLRGNRENPQVLELHEELLAENRGSWDHPPKEVRWASEHLDRARELVAQNADQGRWGFKDPRTLLTLSGWKRVAKKVELAGTFRHPLAVAISLKSRNKIDMEKGVELWNYYNRLLLTAWDEHPFPLVCFDWEKELLNQKISEAARRLGLDCLTSENQFFDPELRHHETNTESSLPKDTRAIYRALEERAL